jgi:hypothetical protein
VVELWLQACPLFGRHGASKKRDEGFEMSETENAPRSWISLYSEISKDQSTSREHCLGETIITEQVETVDGDRSIDFVLTSLLTG